MHQKPNQRLKNQTCIVTGANSGIGKEVALAMGKEGANVIVNYISHPEATQEIVDQIKHFGSGAQAMGFQADVYQQRCMGNERCTRFSHDSYSLQENRPAI